jgi:hypothetical protein
MGYIVLQEGFVDLAAPIRLSCDIHDATVALRLNMVSAALPGGLRGCGPRLSLLVLLGLDRNG